MFPTGRFSDLNFSELLVLYACFPGSRGLILSFSFDWMLASWCFDGDNRVYSARSSSSSFDVGVSDYRLANCRLVG